ncbi:hypothetical protein SO694_00126058 [Aureococcus anophagefferens]|uniref:Uncharacterized protein n=1 Tax=Aureococcus anophagefferens TaxID=44056 RepID=A0ABR1G3M0_AURAN
MHRFAHLAPKQGKPEPNFVGTEDEIDAKCQAYLNSHGYLPIDAHYAILRLDKTVLDQESFDRAFRKRYDKEMKKLEKLRDMGEDYDGGERVFRRLTVAHLALCKHAYEQGGEATGVTPDPFDLDSAKGKLKTAAPAPAPAGAKPRPRTPEALAPPTPPSRLKGAVRSSMRLWKDGRPTPDETPPWAPDKQHPSLRGSIKAATLFGGRGGDGFFAPAPAPAFDPRAKLKAAARSSTSAMSLFGGAKEKGEERAEQARKAKEEKGPESVDEAKSYFQRRRSERAEAKAKREREEKERFDNSRLGKLQREQELAALREQGEAAAPAPAPAPAPKG